MLWLLFLNGGMVLNPFAIVIGALLPDCDHRRAPAGWLLPLWAFGFRHRGFTHSLQATALFTVLLFSVSERFAVSFAVGYLSHLLLDSATPSSVRWLWRAK